MSKPPLRATALALSVALSMIATIPATAGSVTLQAAQFSADKPVPHLHFEGEVVPGDLERTAVAVSQYVDCDPAMLPDTGGNCAVFTLASEGGNYVEGLLMAHFFRENAIATWVKTGSHCYSACAFAFLLRLRLSRRLGPVLRAHHRRLYRPHDRAGRDPRLPRALCDLGGAWRSCRAIRRRGGSGRQSREHRPDDPGTRLLECR